MDKKTDIKGLICLLIPLVIVFFMFTTNLIGSITSEPIKFKVTLYDPFDIIRGKYLDITLEEREVIIPELLGVYSYENDYQYKFISTYKNLSSYDKNDLKNYLNNVFDTIEYQNKHLQSSANIDGYIIDDDLITIANDYVSSMDEGFKANTESEFRNDIIELGLIARKCNLDMFEIIENVEPKLVEYDEYREYRDDIENRQYYIYYSVDDNQYASFDQISSKKIKGKKNYIRDNISILYNRGDIIWSAIIDGSGKEFYMDERLSKVAEDAVRDAINEDKEVVIVAKLANGNMQIEKLLVDDIDIYDYLEEYEVEKQKELEKQELENKN